MGEVTEWSIDELMAENERRNVALRKEYDPVKGLGCVGERVRKLSKMPGEGYVWIPKSMSGDAAYKSMATAADYVRLRCRHDFEYWGAKCVIIKDKTSGRDIPFVLNAPQRTVLEKLETERMAGRPLRFIILKARQWGGSTLVQLYMAWIQITQMRNWNSLICAHVKDTSATIRGMFTKVLDRYPREYWEEEEQPSFKPFERTINTRIIPGRGCKVTVGSSENQDAVRGNDYSMAHLSEVAFWRKTPQASPGEFIRAVCGAINTSPMTLIVLESTANGVGNYFHKEWLRASAGQSDKKPIFVAWHEIEIYRKEVADARKLWESMDDYERKLWKTGLTLEMIQWYHDKRAEYQDHAQMQAEYPTDATEAFAANDLNVFNSADIEELRKGCVKPQEKFRIKSDKCVGRDAFNGLAMEKDNSGELIVWRRPGEKAESHRYVVGVDVGGRSRNSDWSVIVVIDRFGGDKGDKPEVVAQWRGHCDHDILAWKAVQIGRLWHNALVAFESNTFETENIDGDPGMYILAQVRRYYSNLYHRKSDEGGAGKIGFHTNRATKSMIINGMVAAVRDKSYIERDGDALNEYATYQVHPNGSYAAQEGCHDDMLMARAIALHVASTMPRRTNPAAERAYYNRFW